MEELEIKKPEKLLIAISALGNHGKTLSTNRLIELLISHREGWLYDSRSINLKKEQLAILQRNGTAEIAVITIGDGVDSRFEDWYNIVASIPTIKSLLDVVVQNMGHSPISKICNDSSIYNGCNASIFSRDACFD